MLQPGRYRRRAPIVEAVRITADNIHEAAELVGGTVVNSVLSDQPIIRLPGSIHPGRVGNYLTREGDNPWTPVGATLFDRWYQRCGR